MQACADAACSVLCTSWGTSVGACAVGSGGLPSSTSTLTTLTVYAAGDTTCSGSNGSTVYTINANGGCNQVLSAAGVPQQFFYVRATNMTGAIVGGVVGGAVALALIIVAVIFCCRAAGRDCCVGCCGPARKAGGPIQAAAQAPQGPMPPGFAVPPPPPAGMMRV